MARTKQSNRKSTGGKLPRRQNNTMGNNSRNICKKTIKKYGTKSINQVQTLYQFYGEFEDYINSWLEGEVEEELISSCRYIAEDTSITKQGFVDNFYKCLIDEIDTSEKILVDGAITAVCDKFNMCLPSDCEDQYEVEAIVSHKGSSKMAAIYQVKWKGDDILTESPYQDNVIFDNYAAMYGLE
eukprot:TRINITY_DN22877_c0_g1_i1.p1 TRINITY_DN22877_c0_g1~~TRINITY_DN22877_c0_g1_i1.p1  ORF type:complete len:184 (-),score=32.81 TRINITY_DN22877_c0_g1_i1:143-694(-)